MCKMMTSPGAFFVFSKFQFPARYWGKKAKNGSKWQKILLGYQSTIKYWLYPFLPRSSQKPVRPPTFMCNPPQNFEELDSPFEMYPCPKKQRLIFERNKRFYFQQWNENTFECWNMNTQLQNLKIKGEVSFF